MSVNDKAIVLAAQVIFQEINGEYWSDASPQQQRDYIGVARAALIAAGVELAS
jgi:hypothetical protein